METEETAEALFTQAFDPHSHPEIPGELGQQQHVHAPAADWSVSFGVPMGLRHDEKLDLIEAMEFKALAMSMSKQLDEQREATDLAAMSINQQQLTIIGWNADKMVLDSLMILMDQVQQAHGIDPPAQLQPVESSNIRSFGYTYVEEAELGALYVAFNSGALWRYLGVPQTTVRDFIAAESHGAFFQAFIRNEFEAKKMAAVGGSGESNDVG